MAKFALLTPEGFDKVVAFVTDQKVSFNHLKRAQEVAVILTQVQIADVQLAPPVSIPEETPKTE